MRQRPRRFGSCRAFTLVELLVLVGIIAVLVGVLMPAISGARQQSLAVQCASNLRQIGIALETYDQAYHRLPAATSPLSATLTEMKTGTPEMFVCPASGADRGENYRMNEAFAGLPKSAGNPSDVLAREMAESPTGGSQQGGPAPQRSRGVRHRGKLNVLYFDGHVKALSSSEN